MTDAENATPPGKPVDERAERLAAALRENLRRRKAQARERKDAPPRAPVEAEPGED